VEYPPQRPRVPASDARGQGAVRRRHGQVVDQGAGGPAQGRAGRAGGRARRRGRRRARGDQRARGDRGGRGGRAGERGRRGGRRRARRRTGRGRAGEGWGAQAAPPRFRRL
ncbi:MAG: hypothetical protein AVDCRST_MAG40-3004, partial [uncultured Gemmatimonadaceae bacterium]